MEKSLAARRRDGHRTVLEPPGAAQKRRLVRTLISEWRNATCFFVAHTGMLRSDCYLR